MVAAIQTITAKASAITSEPRLLMVKKDRIALW
jgi:hypothetical protein